MITTVEAIVGYVVDSTTLTQFFTSHFLIPFAIMSIKMIHLLFLHQTGSNNPLGLNKNILHLLFIHACVPLSYFVFCYGFISGCNVLWMITVSEECSQ